MPCNVGTEAIQGRSACHASQLLLALLDAPSCCRGLTKVCRSVDLARRVLAVLDHEPVNVDTVVARAALSVGEAALGLEQLAQRGLAVVERGWWSRPR